MTDFHSPDFSDRQDALRAMAQPREGEVEFWNRQREFTYGPIEPMEIKRVSFLAWVMKWCRAGAAAFRF